MGAANKNNKHVGYYPHALVSAVFAIMLFIYGSKTQIMLQDADFWWHIKAGEAISALGKIPEYDIFSFSMAGSDQKWLNISWLWDVFYNYLHKASGPYLPLVANMFTNAITMSLLVWFILSRDVRIVAVFLTIFLYIAPFNYMSAPRPHSISFMMTILFYIISHQATAYNNKKLLLWQPLLMVIWVNCHGGFLIGFIILGAYMLEALYQRKSGNIKWLAIAIISCLFATLINPVGIDIFAATNRTLSSSLLPYIEEWKPLQANLLSTPYLLYILFFFLILSPLAKKAGLAEKILAVLWLFMAVQHIRNIPIAVLLSAPLLAIRLSELLEKLPDRVKVFLLKKNDDYKHDLEKTKTKAAAFFLSLAIAVAFLSGIIKPLLNISVPDTHPVEEVEYLRMHYKDLNVLNEYTQGGYIIYGIAGNGRIFVDGRAETAYSDDVIREYLDMAKCLPGWDKILNKYNINAALLPKDDCLIAYFDADPDWQKVFTGKLDNVYIHKSKINALK